MSQTQTVTVNGRTYDAHTGLPIVEASVPVKHTTRQALRQTTAAEPKKAATTPVVAAHKQATPARQIHQKTQRSKTLNRKFTKKPAAITSLAAAQKTAPAIIPRTSKRIDGIQPAKSSSLHRTPMAATKQAVRQAVAPLPATQQQPAVAKTPSPAVVDTPPMAHPVVARAHQVQASKKAVPAKELPPASVIKQSAIQQALDNAPAAQPKQHKRLMSYRQRLTGVVCGCAALVLFAGYLTYLNVPNISVRVAAAQAGIDASYPGYQPDGYRLNGPVAFSNGQVQMQFAANTGASGFTLNQARSSWDSSALLENYVKEKSHDEYSTAQEKGLTIYNYGSNAAWVSGGILYTIDGDAPLSPDQIRKIATSV